MTNRSFELSRRHVLQVGAISFLGLGLPELFARESRAAGRRAVADESKPAGARNIILVWLGGGPSTIDMWDLKPSARAEIRGEFKPISTAADGIEICEHLPKMAEQMDHCTLIRSVSHTVAEHGQGTEYVLTGNPISPALEYPSIGSIVSSQTSSDSDRSVPAYMDLSGGNVGRAGYLGASHNPFVAQAILPFRRPRPGGTPPVANQFALPAGFTIDDLGRRRNLLSQLEHGFKRFEGTARAEEMSEFQQQALDILTAGKTREALDVRKEKPEVLQRYASTPLGLNALAARRLVQAGVRFVTIGMNGWDTHTNNFGQLRDTLLPPLDTSLSALIADLNDVGLLDETIVYCVGEFNRTPAINGQSGRDHWARAMSVLVAGGGFKPGFAYGETDSGGFEPSRDGCSPADVNATVLNQIGIGPDTRLVTNSGRPMSMFRHGHVLDGATI